MDRFRVGTPPGMVPGGGLFLPKTAGFNRLAGKMTIERN
jgi:hypothetical protein